MPASKRARAKLKDSTEKLHGAEEAASADGAGALAKADLKLLEQEVVAEKLKTRRDPMETAAEWVARVWSEQKDFQK